MSVLQGLITFSAAALSGAPAGGSLLFGTYSGPDVWFGKGHRVVGTIKIASNPDVPTIARVRLIDEKSALLIREVWSNAAGDYAFENVGVGPWSVLAYDESGEYNAVVSSAILGTLM